MSLKLFDVVFLRCFVSLPQAVMSVHPEGIRTKCSDGNTPLHLYLHRETVDMDVVRLLVNYYPEALLVQNNRNQLPLHLALDVPMPNLPAIQLVLKVKINKQNTFKALQ